MSESDRHRRDDVAAYALGALEPEESAEFERHLAGCERCRRDLEWFSPAIESLGDSVERIRPPARLREELLETVRAEAARPARTGAARRSRWSLGELLRRPAIGLAAVAALLGVAAIAYTAGGGGDGPKTITSRSAPGKVMATLKQRGDAGTLELTGLSQLPSSEVYQAWVQRKGGFMPSSLFAARRNGTASAAIPADLDGAQKVLVTVEPRGGSEAPTSAPLVSVPLNS